MLSSSREDVNAQANDGAVGNKQCIGKNLALTEIRLVVAHLLNAFEVEFVSQHDSIAFERDMRDQVTCQPGDCWLNFKRRGSDT